MQVKQLIKNSDLEKIKKELEEIPILKEYNFLNSSLLFKNYISKENLTINNLDDLVAYYLDDKKKSILKNGEYTWKIFRNSREVPDLTAWITFKTAFDFWSIVSKNKFTYDPNIKTDFNLGFSRVEHYTSTNRRCENFDYNTIAHAYYPNTHYAGEIHFNDNMKFSLDKRFVSFSLLHVAIHEIGHALGLEHSRNRKSIMFPSASYNSHLKLNLNLFDKEDCDKFK